MTPFLKWAGGKRWLFTDQFLVKLQPFERYIEPFLGGAAGFFRLDPDCALLSDVNEELINLYRQVKSDPEAIADAMGSLQHQHSEEFYYAMRSSEPTERQLCI